MRESAWYPIRTKLLNEPKTNRLQSNWSAKGKPKNGCPPSFCRDQSVRPSDCRASVGEIRPACRWSNTRCEKPTQIFVAAKSLITSPRIAFFQKHDFRKSPKDSDIAAWPSCLPRLARMAKEPHEKTNTELAQDLSTQPDGLVHLPHGPKWHEAAVRNRSGAGSCSPPPSSSQVCRTSTSACLGLLRVDRSRHKRVRAKHPTRANHWPNLDRSRRRSVVRPACCRPCNEAVTRDPILRCRWRAESLPDCGATASTHKSEKARNPSLRNH